MKKLLVTLSIFPLALTALLGQYYTDLGDNTGFNVSQFQTALNTAAMELVEAFPEEYQDSFRVYSTGFYLHSGDFQGGFPEIFELAVEKVETMSKYYLLIGRQSDETGLYKKFWVKLELPKGDIFSCFNDTQRAMEQLRCSDAINDGLPMSTPSQYLEHEKIGMKTIIQTIEKQEICCDQGRTSCAVCPDANLIRNLLMNLGFVGIDVSGVSNGSPNTTYSNVIDYSGKSIGGVQLAVKAAVAIENVSNPNESDAKAYITDNFSICQDTTFDLAQEAYESNINDFDIWIHLWQSEDLAQTILFVKADFYVLWDDPDFVSYILGEPISLTEDPPTRTPTDEDVVFLIYDPGNNRYFFATSLYPLPHTEPPELVNMPEQPVHIVEDGETLGEIATASGGGFTIDSLVAWNRDKLEGSWTTLQIGWELKVYRNEYLELIADELTVYGMPMAILPLEAYNLIPLDQVPKHGLLFTPGAPSELDEMLGKRHRTVVIPEPTPEEEIKKLIKPSKWEKLKPFAIRTGKVLLRIGAGALNIAAFMVEPAPVGNYMPVTFYQFSIDNEPDDKKLTYCTYTKYKNSEVNSGGLPNGKVYVGRTSGYNKIPMIPIANRDLVHHKTLLEGYAAACYDDHEYSVNGSWYNRHQDPAYQIIRGREQVVIEAMGGAWSDMIKKDKRRTRSGNAINGISRLNQGYSLWTGLSRMKTETYGFPPFRPITWVPSEFCLPGWW